MSNKILQFIKFGCVGLSNTAISFIIYWILLYLGVDYLVGNIIGYIMSSIWGYFLNKVWVFKGRTEKTIQSITKYYIVYGSSFLINLVLMYILVDILKFSAILAPLLVMCITIPYNFILNKLWTFRGKNE